MVVKGNGQLHQALQKLLIFRGSFAPCVLQCLVSFEKTFGIEQVNASAKIVLAHSAFCHGPFPSGLWKQRVGDPKASRSLSYKGVHGKILREKGLGSRGYRVM